MELYIKGNVSDITYKSELTLDIFEGNKKRNKMSRV